MVRSFWGVYESTGVNVTHRGVYADRESAENARDLVAKRGGCSPDKYYYILQWLPVYGINTMIGPDGKEIVKDFYTWIHLPEHEDTHGGRWSFCDNMLLAISNAIDQWFAMRPRGVYKVS